MATRAPAPGAAGPRALVLPESGRKGVEDRVHLVETALKDADEGDVRGERRRIRPERAAGLDDGLGRCGAMADAHQAAGERAIPPGLRQRTEQGPAPPGSARNPQPSGASAAPWTWSNRPAAVWQRSSIATRASSL